MWLGIETLGGPPMKPLFWLFLAIFGLSMLQGAEAASGKKQNFGGSKRSCKPPMSSDDYYRCGFGGGGRR
jgi:hypothetical protein